MARMKFNPLLMSVSGTVGEFITKTRNGKSYLARRPDLSGRKLTSAQKENVGRFRKAVYFAREVMADPVAVVPYQQKARKERRTVYNTIISVYMREHGAKSNTQSAFDSKDPVVSIAAANDVVSSDRASGIEMAPHAPGRLAGRVASAPPVEGRKGRNPLPKKRYSMALRRWV